MILMFSPVITDLSGGFGGGSNGVTCTSAIIFSIKIRESDKFATLSIVFGSLVGLFLQLPRRVVVATAIVTALVVTTFAAVLASLR